MHKGSDLFPCADTIGTGRGRSRLLLTTRRRRYGYYSGQVLHHVGAARARARLLQDDRRCGRPYTTVRNIFRYKPALKDMRINLRLVKDLQIWQELGTSFVLREDNPGRALFEGSSAGSRIIGRQSRPQGE